MESGTHLESHCEVIETLHRAPGCHSEVTQQPAVSSAQRDKGLKSVLREAIELSPLREGSSVKSDREPGGSQRARAGTYGELISKKVMRMRETAGA